MSLTSTERFRLVSELFEQAMAMPEGRRGAFVRESSGDHAIAEEVLSLLISAGREDGFLEQPPPELERLRTSLRPAIAAAAASATAAEGGFARPASRSVQRGDPLIGMRIGGHRVVARIASGGMGVLYEAMQEQPRRTVAIKVVRPDMVSPALLARFRREAELLGRLQHPGIAGVFEAGSFAHPDDQPGCERPFCAMELVDGVAVTEWAERRRAGVPEMIELLAAICDAVDHAHVRGVIHRDLKPGNILVTPEGQPKVVDFGIARAADASLAQTLRTGAGDIVGTLGYMSPEQLSPGTREIDERADVYSIGVLAYELLAGRTPFDLRGLSITECLRRLSEETPTRLGSMRRELRGDIEVVVGKAMARDAALRYPTAAALARDLRRILEDRPVSAKPPSALYRLSKFVGRHRAASAASAIAALLLVVAAVGTGVGWHRARAESDRAHRYNEILRAVMASFDPAKLGRSDVSMLHAVDAAALEVAAGVVDLPEAAEELHGMLGERYLLLGSHEAAARHYQLALAAQEALGGAPPLARAELLATLGSTLTECGHPAQGLDRHEESLALRVAVLPANHLRLAESFHNLSVTQQRLGDLMAARRSVDEAIAIVRQHQPAAVAELSWSLAQRGAVLLGIGDLAQAVESTNEAVALREQIQPDDLAKAKLLHRFASVLRHDPASRRTAAEMLGNAIAIRRRFLPAESELLLETRCDLAEVLLEDARPAEARAIAQSILESTEAPLGQATAALKRAEAVRAACGEGAALPSQGSEPALAR
jgi:non-specific serine/threonine protein kinase/serine/threonine-protein kinase